MHCCPPAGFPLLAIHFQDQMIESFMQWLFDWLAIPNVGLFSVFLISVVSATLIPLGSEPAVFAAIKANGAMFWPVILVGTVGNTLGGIINYWLGYGAREAFTKERQSRWFHWLERHGPKTMLLAWLPAIGDPICTLAGWLKLPFWPSVFYMAVGKLLRYLTVTWMLLNVPDGFWRWIATLF
jgi:membrane protein YqaA with SNARE-associated domain